MTKAPILAEKEYYQKGQLYRIRVSGGLHYIRGNSAPHFSLTADIEAKTPRGWRDDSGGACHDEILRHFPQFADLAALHLADINGLPMYAVENGCYYLGGTHWEKFKPEVVAKHFRITVEDAHSLRDSLGISDEVTAGSVNAPESKLAKMGLVDYVERQKPRFIAEACRCIERHDLQLFGDKWENVQLIEA